MSSRIFTEKSDFWDNARRLDYGSDKMAEKILGKNDPLIPRGFGKPGFFFDRISRTFEFHKVLEMDLMINITDFCVRLGMRLKLD